MRFIGQHHIMRQLAFLLPELVLNPKSSHTFLFRGPSGYGKTTMALEVGEYIARGNHFEIYNAAHHTEFSFKKRVIFIDEIHKMENMEFLYPFIDSKKYVYIFATNIDGNLPEAFLTRCDEYNFTDYDDDELTLISMEAATFKAPVAEFLHIIEAGNRNPRIIKGLVTKLNIFFRANPNIDPNTIGFKELLKEVFDIDDGLDTLCRRYLELLDNVGGTASISLLKSLLHIDQNTITGMVEPILLRKNLIRITSKGRTLV